MGWTVKNPPMSWPSGAQFYFFVFYYFYEFPPSFPVYNAGDHVFFSVFPPATCTSSSTLPQKYSRLLQFQQLTVHPFYLLFVLWFLFLFFFVNTRTVFVLCWTVGTSWSLSRMWQLMVVIIVGMGVVGLGFGFGDYVARWSWFCVLYCRQ